MGVQTKFKKHQTTYLLDIPDLIRVINEWDIKVNKYFDRDGLWYAPISPVTYKLDPNNQYLGKYRDDRARKDLKEWMNSVGLKYHSPHKFRRGYAIYSIALSKNSKDMKAISQNMMHSSILTTERYIDLPEKDLKEKKEMLDLMVKNLEKQEEKLKEKSKDIQQDILSNIKKEK